MIHMREYNAFETKNVKFLVSKQIAFATLQITQTGIDKSIMDATAPVRAYFFEKGIHNYERQAQGTQNKKLLESYIITESEVCKTNTSLYRPETKKGDPRLWVYQLKNYVKADDIIAVIAHDKHLYIINLTRINIERLYLSPILNPVKDLIASIYGAVTSVSDELLVLIRNKMSDWLPSEVMADTGIGRTVESVLGIPMNDSKQPDYKGIELKSKRLKSSTKSALFTNAPDWTLSKCKSGKQIVEHYGYIKSGNINKTLQVTVSALKPNPQGLGLELNWNNEWLEMNYYNTVASADGSYRKLNDVSVWTLLCLHQRLAEKHRETFWIDVETRIRGHIEEFRVSKIEHTKNPILPQFDVLLEQGKIIVDLMLSRPNGHGDTYSFKMLAKDRPLLFPESVSYVINP